MLDNDCAHTDMMIYNLERDLDREIERALEESDNNSSDDQEEVPSTTSVPAWIRSLSFVIFTLCPIVHIRRAKMLHEPLSRFSQRPNLKRVNTGSCLVVPNNFRITPVPTSESKYYLKVVDFDHLILIGCSRRSR